MSAPSPTWVRASSRHPCPTCGHDSWCTFTEDKTATRCKRQPSQHQVDGDDGPAWLHFEPGAIRRASALPAAKPKPKLTTEQVDAIVRAAVARVTDDQLHRLAEDLGATIDALRSLQVGWHVNRHGGAFSFPMRDADEQAIGIRLRPWKGRKTSVRGSRSGLFMPSGSWLRGDPLVVVEGASDCAALAPWFWVVGLPSALVGTDMVKQLAAGHTVAVFADRDQAGRTSAALLAKSIKSVATDVFVVMPPPGFKDVRDWIKAGAQHSDVLELFERRGRPVLRTGPLPVDLTVDEQEDLAVRELREDETELCLWREVQP